MKLTKEQKRILKGYFKHDEIIESFEEEPGEEVVEYLIAELDYAKSRLIRFHNKQVADSIEFFVKNGEWVTLDQIMRSLPSEIKRTEKEKHARSIIDKSVKLTEKFMINLTLDEKEKLMNEYEQKKEEKTEK